MQGPFRAEEKNSVTVCESDEYKDLLCVTEADTQNTINTEKVRATKLFAGMLIGKEIVNF